MALFSWFLRRTKVSSTKNSKALIEKELSVFNNNTMWPIAKVRINTVLQQEYSNSAAYLKQATKFNTLKESKINVLKKHIS
jgi:septum formation topological specificity factor MinE